MRVRHLNCATMRPPGGRLINGSGSVLRAGTIICHCLLVETDDGLVLVDTGIGGAAIANPKQSIDPRLLRVVRPALDPAETALAQLTALGYQPGDVRDIVVTHLDFDHVLGITDFPHARIHVQQAELDAARKPVTRPERDRYASIPWSTKPDWVTHQASGEPWFGFDAVRDIPGLPAELLLIPLAGHTRGHQAVAVRDETDGWLLHAGDGYFFHGQLDAAKPGLPLGLRLFENVVDADNTTRAANTERLRDLAQTGEVRIFSAHDPAELDGFTRAGQSAARPA